MPTATFPIASHSVPQGFTVLNTDRCEVLPADMATPSARVLEVRIQSPPAASHLFPVPIRRCGGLLPSARGLAFPVIQYIAAQAPFFWGVDLTPEYRFEVTMKVTKCAVRQEDCSWFGMCFH